MSKEIQPIVGLPVCLNEILMETDYIIHNEEPVHTVEFWTNIVMLNVGEEFSECIQKYMRIVFFKFFYLQKFPNGTSLTYKKKKRCKSCHKRTLISTVNNMCIDCICDLIVETYINF